MPEEAHGHLDDCHCCSMPWTWDVWLDGVMWCTVGGQGGEYHSRS